MFEIHTSIEIDRPAADVWRALTDFEHYGDWNPFITSVKGTFAEGERLHVMIHPPDSKAMGFRPTLLEIRDGECFRWRGRFLLPRVMDGEHRFELEPAGAGRTRLLHSEQFRGVLVPLFRKMMAGSTRLGFEQMNAALKARVEAG